MFNLKGIKTERAYLYMLVNFPNVCISQGQGRPNPGAPCRPPTWVVPDVPSHHRCLSGAVPTGSWNQEWSQHSKLRAFQSETCVAHKEHINLPFKAYSNQNILNQKVESNRELVQCHNYVSRIDVHISHANFKTPSVYVFV